MKLIDALASGIVEAATGTVTLKYRGTTIPAAYYLDFEATQSYLTQTITLDSYGSAVLYVNALVDVRVFDADGVLARQFVAGEAASSVEVISQSFTGTDYTDGSSGSSKPTVLSTVLDAWLTSAGSKDFKVRVEGVDTNLSAAVAGLAGLFFNVKSYGALGDGTADDGGNIQDAFDAAGAGGGTVFFPPGTYRSTVTLSWPAGVKLLGGGGSSSKIAFDSNSLTEGLLVATGSTPTVMEGMWIGSMGAANFTGTLLKQSVASDIRLRDCRLGADTRSTGFLFRQDTTASCSAIVEGCHFEQVSAATVMVSQSVAARAVYRDCTFVMTYNAPSSALAGMVDNFLFDGCSFDASAAASGAVYYISFAPDVHGTCRVVNCDFSPNNTVVPVALYNTLTSPYYDCVESGNSFGTVGSGFTHVTPYGYVTDGFFEMGAYAGSVHHQSRVGRVQWTNTSAASYTADPKAYGITVLDRGSGAALTLHANKGSPGDTWMLHVVNSSGGTVTVTVDTAYMFLSALAANFTVGNGTTKNILFTWLSETTTAGGGRWLQTSTGIQI